MSRAHSVGCRESVEETVRVGRFWLKPVGPVRCVGRHRIRLRTAGKNWHFGSRRVAGEQASIAWRPCRTGTAEIHDNQIREPGPCFLDGFRGVSRLLHGEAPERQPLVPHLSDNVRIVNEQHPLGTRGDAALHAGTHANAVTWDATPKCWSCNDLDEPSYDSMIQNCRVNSFQQWRQRKMTSVAV